MICNNPEQAKTEMKSINNRDEDKHWNDTFHFWTHRYLFPMKYRSNFSCHNTIFTVDSLDHLSHINRNSTKNFGETTSLFFSAFVSCRSTFIHKGMQCKLITPGESGRARQKDGTSRCHCRYQVSLGIMSAAKIICWNTGNKILQRDKPTLWLEGRQKLNYLIHIFFFIQFVSKK